MSCSQGSVTRRRPGTARSLVTELSGSGQIDPTPTVYEDSELLVELYLSPEKLKTLSGSEDLRQVIALEMCVDTRQNSLGNFGAYLPNLVQLKINNSLILSVRDLGTTLSHLQVLWLARCSLADLDGILSFSCLKELYAAYNNVSDLSQVSMLEGLELLDLEGNNVDDLVQVQYLGLCSRLRTLTLEGNPVCSCPHPDATETVEYSYRSAVRELIPQLRYLDDVPAAELEARCGSTTVEDWALLKESIKSYASNDSPEELMEARAASACASSRPCSALRPGTRTSSPGAPGWPGSSRPLSSPGSRPLSSPGSRPLSSPGSGPLSSPGSRPPSYPGSRHSSADSDPATVDLDASDLTHGVGRLLFCGNPVQALRARHQKMKLQAPTSHSSNPCTQPSYVPEHTYDLEECDSQDRSDVLAEFRAWREEHSKRLMVIERERQPQVMSILHSEEEEEEEEGTDRSLSITSDREEEEEEEEEEEGEEGGRPGCHRWRNTDSPDSSFQSPSPDLSEREAISPEVSRLSLSSDHTLSPSPPLAAISPSSVRRPSEVRARRLRLAKPGVALLRPVGESPVMDPGALRGALEHGEMEVLKPQTQPPQGPYTPLKPAQTQPPQGSYTPLKPAQTQPPQGPYTPLKPAQTQPPQGPYTPLRPAQTQPPQGPYTPLRPAQTQPPQGSYTPLRPAQTQPPLGPYTPLKPAQTQPPQGSYTPLRPAQTQPPQGPYTPLRPAQTQPPQGSYTPLRPAQTQPPQGPYTPRRPASSSVAPTLRTPCAEAVRGCSLSVKEHKPVVCCTTPERPTAMRPRIARATPQRPSHP